ncbi:MAG TPA: hypothetical protein DEZ08_07490 [Dehalococcoidia bacterium]|nr:hypothetical protein [Dehalococcoidia bacterium]
MITGFGLVPIHGIILIECIIMVVTSSKIMRQFIKNSINCNQDCSLKTSSSENVPPCKKCNMKIIGNVLVSEPSIENLEDNRKLQKTFTGWKKTNHNHVINFLNLHSDKNWHILDVGTGSHNLSEIYPDINPNQYYTLDIQNNNHLDIICDLTKSQPLKEIFDVIICLNVLEHVYNYNDFLNNTLKMLKPNGYFLFAVPYHSGLHQTPYDYFRYSNFALEKIFTEHKLEIIEIEPVHNGFNPWASLSTYKTLIRNNNNLLSTLTTFMLNMSILISRIAYKINRDIIIDGHYSEIDEQKKNQHPELKLKSTPTGYVGTLKKL